MVRDQSWINWKTYKYRKKPEYMVGVKEFLDFSFAHVCKEGKIRCPCVNCDIYSHHDRKTVFIHLMNQGILRHYTIWEFHGEKTSLEGHTNSTGENASNEEYRQDYMDPNVYNNVDEIVFNVT